MTKMKKGFTLVELLVVIAILAILATVSIVAYTSFIDRANMSVDQQVVEQLNDLLLAADVEKEFNTIGDVKLFFAENGFNPEYNCAHKNYSLAWLPEENKIVLVENEQIVYPSDYKGRSGYRTFQDKWDGVTIDEHGLEENKDEDQKILEIHTSEQLAAFAKSVNEGTTYAGYTVRLMADIDLNNKEWTQIGTSANPFSGSFDGQGHTISNLLITKEVGNIAASNRQGLFGTIKSVGATYFKNLTLHNANVTGGYHVGAILGTIDGSSQSATGNYFIMSDIKLTGLVKVYGWEGVGGVNGSGNMAEISNIEVNVEVGSYVTTMPNGRTNSFACVGSVKGGGYLAKVDNIKSNMDVTAKTAGTGGLFGVIGGQTVVCNLSNLYYSGKVTLTETSLDKTGSYQNYQYNGLLVGAPRFNVVADQATCSSDGTLELHTENTVETSNNMGNAFVWGEDLFGASRDSDYTNKSYANDYTEK